MNSENNYLLLTSPDTFDPTAAIFTGLESNELGKYLEKQNFLRPEQVSLFSK